jgi:hypothetical protein
LRKEVDELASLLRPLPKGTHPPLSLASGSYDRQRGETPSTLEPRSSINEAIYRLKTVENLSLSSGLLIALARDLDGALRDIRTAKLDVKSIVDDPNARDTLRKSRVR